MDVSKVASATERLIAFENRFKGRHAKQHALDCGLDERDLHQSRVDETYNDFEENTIKAISADAGLCKEKAYSMFDTNAKTGAEFLQFERERHSNPGKNIEIYLNQLRKLCTIRGCPHK